MGDSSSSAGIATNQPTTATLPTGRIKRITMFKIPGLENQQALVEAYTILEGKTAKNAEGKSYIVSTSAGIVEDPARAKGYTVIGTTEFHSIEMMRFYDEECREHAALKEKARELGVEEPPLVAYWRVRVDPAEEVGV